MSVESLNQRCFCISLDEQALRHDFETAPETRGVYPLILQNAPHLFASSPVFVARAHLERMAAIVEAAESVIALPAYRELVLGWSAPIARFDAGGARGVFLSYDFHVTAEGPSLIEINTNAGGALLNAALARAQRACCPEVAGMASVPSGLEGIDETFARMFFEEWRRVRGAQPLRRIAIVDADPEAQYLYPEFILFRELFHRHGLDAVIADPAALSFDGTVLRHGDVPVDLVYNRLTDFMLEDPAHDALRRAYLEGAVVVTPHPRAHALYANKRNLTVLTDPVRLASLGADADVIRTLQAGIPVTRWVREADPERLWAERRRLFFKPVSGYGSKAAYRGEKLTRRVWGEILAGDYVAQALVAPGERRIASEGEAQPLKFDVRNYVYDGQVQFVTARLYQGQTTNFRTAGGGFAPVFTERDGEAGDDVPGCSNAAVRG